MARFRSQYGYLLVLPVLLLVIVPSGGCTSALATAMYVIKGTDIPAEFDGMRDKRVAVVCRPMVELQYRNAGVASDLSRKIGVLLQQKGRGTGLLSQQRDPRIDVVGHQEVAEWVDENSWEEYAEIGKAVDADLVLGVELERFSIYEGQTLYQGRANVTIQVCDSKTGDVLFEKSLPEVVYPPNRAIPTSERQEPQFRREFVQVLADQIGRHFYPHDAYADFARDTSPLE